MSHTSNSVASRRELVDFKVRSYYYQTSKRLLIVKTCSLSPSYRQAAARVAKTIKKLPRTPAQEAADWVEYTQAQGGLQYLRPRGLDLAFYQLYLLDVLLLAVVIIIVFLLIIKFIFKFVKSLFTSKKKEKTP